MYTQRILLLLGSSNCIFNFVSFVDHKKNHKELKDEFYKLNSKLLKIK